LSKSFFAQVFYGFLCRVQETAICSAVSWRGVRQITSAEDL